ncbi:MAG: NUDIX domain-containing protein [Patescibacteria group bacterium]
MLDKKVAGLPGGKLAEDEDPRGALERELSEELGLSVSDFIVTGCEASKGSPVIRALPNLRAVRTDYIFTMALRSDHPYLAIESFKREEHGHAALFKWIPYADWRQREAKRRAEYQ